MIEEERVAAIRRLITRGWGINSVARQLGMARNTVRRYVRRPVEPGVQIRPASRRLTDEWHAAARRLFRGRAAGNAAVVHQFVTEHGIGVSLRTIQRVVATLRRSERGTDPATGHRPTSATERPGADLPAPESGAGMSAQAELDLAKRIAKAKCRADSDELESELTLHVARLRRRSRSGIAVWRAYLITALNRRSDKWLEKQRRDRKRTTSLDREVVPDDGQAVTLKDLLPYMETALEDQTALALVRDELDPKFKAVWDALLKTDGKPGQAAKEMKKHRNTLRPMIRQLQDIFKRHGF